MHIPQAEILLLVKLFLAHILTDFVFQTKKMLEHKKSNVFAILWHGIITATVATLLFSTSGYEGGKFYLFTLILSTHTLIDWAKITLAKQYSTPTRQTRLFFADQAAHVIVILFFWLSFFHRINFPIEIFRDFSNSYLMVVAAGYIIVTQPAAIIIREIIRNYKIEDEESSPVVYNNGQLHIPGSKNTSKLLQAGFAIGVLERILILTLVLHTQYTAIGFLVAAKSILRINDADKNFKGKTEYIIIGTLLSFGMAIMVGELVKLVA